MSHDHSPPTTKTCLVTGATSGIGEVTARELARGGTRVIVVGRDPQRCAATVEHIKGETGNSEVEYLVADLSSQADIRGLADVFLERHKRLDVLVNNAGAVFLRRQESIDGIEKTFALNHLSYFLLTNLLLDTLKASTPSRIVNVSSNSHYGSALDFDDLQSVKRYRSMKVYGRSKFANVLFTYELARRLEGTGVTVNALHPGFVRTNMGKNNGWLVRLLAPVWQISAISTEEGARTSIFLASSPEVEGMTGKFFVQEKVVRSDPATYDETSAKRLWEISAEIIDL